MPVSGRRKIRIAVCTIAVSLLSARARRPHPQPRRRWPRQGPSRTSSVLVSGPQIDFVRAKIETGEQPWATAFGHMIASKLRPADLRPQTSHCRRVWFLLESQRRLH
jgi:hypothetical protein